MAISKEELLELEIKQKNGIKLSKEEKNLLKANSAEEKAKKAKMSFGERLLKVAKSEYASLGDEDRFPIRDWISTGNYLFNAQISADPYKGVPSGRVVQLAGISSSGKTFMALETAKNAQDLGYYVVLYDSEMANNDKEALKARGIDTSKLMYIPIDTVENLKTSMLNILDECTEDDKLMIIVDSIGNLSTNKELEDSTEGSTTKDMTRPAQLKALFRTATLKAGVKNVPVLIINHVYAQIGSFVGGNVTGGGSGPQYNSSIVVEFTKAQEKGSDGRMSGALVSSIVTKCRTAKERTKIKFTIDFESGLKPWSGMLQFVLDEGLLEKDGRGFKLNSKIPNNFWKEEKISKITEEFWKSFMDAYLYKYLVNKFKYQSLSDDLGLTEDFKED